MHRPLLAASALVAALTIVACGSGAAANTGGAAGSANPSASAPAGRGFRGGTGGEVVKVGGTSLVLNTQQGDVTVDFTSSTPVSRTSTGVLADITQGACITATGSRDGSGAFTATGVNISDPVNGSCSGFPGGGRPSFSPNPGFSPNPDRTPRAGSSMPVVRGRVTAVDGVTVTVLQTNGQASGQSTTITVPTTVTVNRTQSASTSDIAAGDCVAAIGQTGASGVVEARTLSIQPAGPSGCFTGGRGGFRGGFGGGGFGGGGGGFGGGGGGNGAGGAASGD